MTRDRVGSSTMGATLSMRKRKREVVVNAMYVASRGVVKEEHIMQPTLSVVVIYTFVPPSPSLSLSFLTRNANHDLPSKGDHCQHCV